MAGIEKTPWFKILGLTLSCLTLWFFVFTYVYDAIADQVSDLKVEQEKKHDKIDEKFDKVVSEMNKTNIELAKVVVLLKERTEPNKNKKGRNGG